MMTTSLRFVPPLFQPLFQRLGRYAELVKFEHTIFAMPFALSAMLLALPPAVWPTFDTVCWVIFAMIGGRTFAMGLNRILDADIDAKNPRTRGRGLPAGTVKHLEAWGLTLFSAVVFTAATSLLPPVCLQLLPVAFAIFILYSYMKRFSSLAHLVLGLALGSSAVGGWVAVTGELSSLPILFGLAVLFWVSGFDVIYACQDARFDQAEGLHSIPARLGIPTALRLSRLFHVLAVSCLLSFGLLYPFTGYGYWSATVLTAGMLIYEHSLVNAEDLSKVNEAFFTVNGRISLSVFVLIFLDKLVAGF